MLARGKYMSEVLGWVSSTILVITLFTQVRKQWHDDTSKGVSIWLFIGQLAASSGFLLYSVQIRNWVFTVTNVLTGIAALLGLWIVRVHRRRRNARTSRSEVLQRTPNAI
jgi:MtN3 and saliva related transmembrane protein